MSARESGSFSVETTERAAVVEAVGEIDMGAAHALRAALDSAVATGSELIVLDLGAATFLDSAGLAVVFGVQRRLPVSQRLLIANVPERMLRMLRLAAVGAVLEVHPVGAPTPWRD